MVKKYVVFLLGTMSTSALQTVLGGVSCLSSTYPAACCSPGSAGEAVELVNGVAFQYNCGYFPAATECEGHTVKDAATCAALCGRDRSCRAASWYTGDKAMSLGNCYLVKGRGYTRQRHPDYMILSKDVREEDYVTLPVDPPDATLPVDPPGSPPFDNPPPCPVPSEYPTNPVPSELQECEEEKQLYWEQRQSCENNKAVTEIEREQCRTEKDILAERKTQCRAEQQQCQNDKAECTTQRQICEIHKDKLALEVADQQDKISELEAIIATLNSTQNLPPHNGLFEPGTTCQFSPPELPGPQDDSCILVTGGLKYRLDFTRRRATSKAKPTSIKGLPFHECAQLCASEKCTFAVWKHPNRGNNIGTCYTHRGMMSNLGASRLPGYWDLVLI